MTTLEKKFNRLLPEFLTAVPMDDTKFISTLQSGGMFPGDTKGYVTRQRTEAEKVSAYLNRCIEPAFSDNGKSNEPLRKLLVKMKQSGYPAAIKLVKQFESGGKLWHAYIIAAYVHYVCMWASMRKPGLAIMYIDIKFGQNF